MFEQLKTYLQRKKIKNVDYGSFRKVLSPCASFLMYVFDSAKIDKIDYGHDIRSRLIRMFSLDQNALFMEGDYIIDDSKKGPFLKSLLKDKGINVSNWSNMTQYYLVCILGISKEMSKHVNAEFIDDNSYCGYTDLSIDFSPLKSYFRNDYTTNEYKNKQIFFLFCSR